MWHEFLRVGKFKTNTNMDLEITKEDLNHIAKSYNPVNFSAPLTVGHVKSDKDPAYGDVSNVKVFGDILCFKAGKVVKEFAEAVNKGMYSKVSAGLDLLEDGKKSLNHIAFLGAQKPAVDGLKPITSIALSASDRTQIIEMSCKVGTTAEFGAPDTDSVQSRLNVVSTILSGIREFIIDKYDVETADKHISSWDLEYLSSSLPEASELVASKSTASFSTPVVGDDESSNEPDYKKLFEASEVGKEALASELQSSQTKIAELESAASTKSVEDAKTELSAYVDNQIDANKLLPAEKPFVLKTLESLGNLESAEFSGNYETVELSAYKKSIENRKTLTLTKEIANGGANEQIAPSGIELSGYADQHMAEMANKGITVNNIEAVDFVQKNLSKFVNKS